MKGFIYIIKNTVNNKVYIGQTRTSVNQRWSEHLRHANYGNYVINRAMRKYGIKNFYVETLEICDLDILDEREIYYIDLYDSTNKDKGYNVSIGGKTPKVKRKVLNINDLIDLYVNKQFTVEQIGKKFNVSRYIITTELKNAGIKLRDRHESATKFNKIGPIEIISAIQVYKTLRSTAKFLNVPYTTLRKACKYYNIEYNSPTSAQHSNE